MSVESLAEYTGKSSQWSVIDMLKAELKLLESGERTPNKAIILFLKDGDEEYSVGFGNAQMNSSEIIALLEVVKTMMLADMGYL